MDIKYLDEVPIHDYLIDTQLGVQENLAYRSYLNLAMNTNNAISRLDNLHLLQEKEINTQTGTNMYTYLLSIESFMCTLLWVPTISSIDRSTITCHYERRNYMVDDNKILPSEVLARELMFSSNRTWGTPYGSLGYYINLEEDIYDYLSPSQMIDISIKGLMKLMKERVLTRQDDDSLLAYLERLDSLFLEDSTHSDTLLYKAHINILNSLSLTKDSLYLLRFMSSWIPLLIEWYMKKYELDNSFTIPPQPVGDLNKKVYSMVIELIETCLSYGMGMDSTQDLLKKWLYQDIPPYIFSVSNQVIRARKLLAYELEDITDIYLKRLIQPLLELGLDLEEGLLRNSSQLLLDVYAPPAGYNLYLVMLAASLLNRAYILTHNSIGMRNSTDPDYELLGRTNRILFLAGRLLRKSNLSHIQIIGENIQVVSEIEIEDEYNGDILNE